MKKSILTINYFFCTILTHGVLSLKSSRVYYKTFQEVMEISLKKIDAFVQKSFNQLYKTTFLLLTV